MRCDTEFFFERTIEVFGAISMTYVNRREMFEGEHVPWE